MPFGFPNFIAMLLITFETLLLGKIKVKQSKTGPKLQKWQLLGFFLYKINNETYNAYTDKPRPKKWFTSSLESEG